LSDTPIYYKNASYINIFKYICICFEDFCLFFAFLKFCKNVKSRIMKNLTRLNIKYSVCHFIFVIFLLKITILRVGCHIVDKNDLLKSERNSAETQTNCLNIFSQILKSSAWI